MPVVSQVRRTYYCIQLPCKNNFQRLHIKGTGQSQKFGQYNQLLSCPLWVEKILT